MLEINAGQNTVIQFRRWHVGLHAELTLFIDLKRVVTARIKDINALRVIRALAGHENYLPEDCERDHIVSIVKNGDFINISFSWGNYVRISLEDANNLAKHIWSMIIDRIGISI